MMLSQTEENYLKAIHKIMEKEAAKVSTNAIAKSLNTKAASVTDMLQRLSEKELVSYEKYKGAELTEEGRKVSTQLIRKHRLWEVFLQKKLNFNWDEVHEVAEQLEHIKSPLLIKRLNAYLGFPKFDPHGGAIPDADGNIEERDSFLLSEVPKNNEVVMIGVKDSSSELLRYLSEKDLVLGTHIIIQEKNEYDSSLEIMLNDKNSLSISDQIGSKIFVKPL